VKRAIDSAKTKTFKDTCDDDADWEKKSMAYAWANRKNIQNRMAARAALIAKCHLEKKAWEVWDDSMWDVGLERFKEVDRWGRFDGYGGVY
jgi:hypothetical protein